MYLSLGDAALAFSISTPYSFKECYESLLYSINNGYVKPADVRVDIPDKWTPIINIHGDIDGWFHRLCGFHTKEPGTFCPTCGAKMELPKVRMTKGKKYD